MSYIYIVYNGRHYKVGVSATPERRVKQLQTASSTPLRLLKTYPVDVKLARKIEQQIHKMLWQRRARHKGEWFDLTEEHLNVLDEWIDSIQQL